MNFEDVTGVSGVGQASPDLGPMAEFLVPFSIALCLVVLAFMIAATWKMFKKAGEHGWAAFVPVYSTYVLFKIAWGSGWMFLLMFVPVVGFIVSIITLWKLSRAFNIRAIA